MTVVVETVLTYIPHKRKTTPSGWTSFNAPCCHHNGHSADTRGRGGVIQNDDGISYHCFNCGFKASWQPGRPFSHKMRKLLQWMGTPDDAINKVALDVMRENEGHTRKTAPPSMFQYCTHRIHVNCKTGQTICEPEVWTRILLRFLNT